VNRADTAQGEALSEKVVWQLIKPYAEAAGVPGIAPHDLRLPFPGGSGQVAA
jgi:site-specific recombinase XerD